jgi:hypothetical protein
MTDAELIEAIQKASNKQVIDIADLPNSSKTTIADDYPEDYADAAQLAPELGYEVQLRCDRGPRVGERWQAYFDLRGRMLRGDRDGAGKGDQGKGDGQLGGEGKRACFKFVLPVSFTMPDETTITIEEKGDWMLIRQWYKENPGFDQKPQLQFPVDIEWRDGTVTTINNEEEMREARAKCDKDKGDKKRCFHLVLPVTYNMPDGSTITIEEKEDWVLLKQWYDENPGYDEKPVLQFPVDIKWKDGTIQTINNEEEMTEAREKCGEGKKRCFRLVYPVTYILPDGTEVTIQSRNDREGWMEIKDWYKEHPDVKKRPALQYPVDIKYKDGTVVTINNEEELIEAKEDCKDKD